ncbi:MAG TPA: NAD-dependent succinate-semialdehyde dehydrogenase [Polyangia bacterium]|nr:NAD-dependent succinate-semialdehyde dehydrogenase [Polyangia bacterium]
MAIATINPATGRQVERFEPLAEADIETRLGRAADAARLWRTTSFAERAARLRRLGELLDGERERWAQVIVTEMGKTIRAARAEVEKCARTCRFYADEGARMLAEEVVVAGDDRRSIVYQPLGPVLAIMPWNFPFWQVVRFAAPALMAGNVALLKHASNVPRCALGLEELCRKSGFPEGAFQTLLVETGPIAGILADARVAAVTLTGSDSAGAAVAELAGRHLKKAVLELGGSDPFLVMPSADLDAAVRTAVDARVLSNGQSCIAAKRFIVHEAVYDRFAAGMCEAMRALGVGDPMREETDVGPLATASARERLVDQIERSVAAGARRLVGAATLPGDGWYFSPGVLADIPPSAPASQEEIFGPVALLHRARSIDHAIAIANDSRYGLGAAAWTRDPAEAARFVRDLEAGSVFVNEMVVSDPRLPFGGIKRSGFGRELGAFGIREFVNIKTVVLGGLGGS